MYKPDQIRSFLSRLRGLDHSRLLIARPLRCLVTAICAICHQCAFVGTIHTTGWFELGMRHRSAVSPIRRISICSDHTWRDDERGPIGSTSVSDTGFSFIWDCFSFRSHSASRLLRSMPASICMRDGPVRRSPDSWSSSRCTALMMGEPPIGLSGLAAMWTSASRQHEYTSALTVRFPRCARGSTSPKSAAELSRNFRCPSKSVCTLRRRPAQHDANGRAANTAIRIRLRREPFVSLVACWLASPSRPGADTYFGITPKISAPADLMTQGWF